MNNVLTVVQGTNASALLTAYDLDGSRLDLTTATIYVAVAGPGGVAFQKASTDTSPATIVKSDQTNPVTKGQATVYFFPADTATLSWTDAYEYDCQVVIGGKNYAVVLTENQLRPAPIRFIIARSIVNP